MAGACGRSNRSQSKAMIFATGVSKLKIKWLLSSLSKVNQTRKLISPLLLLLLFFLQIFSLMLIIPGQWLKYR
jgi:hypothetical protein